MKLIVGVGNPGRGYAGNRHNAGFMCLAHFARTHRIELNKKQGKARVAIAEINGIKLVMARPQTYMNLSGEAVKPLVKKFSIAPEDLLVINDDLDLPAGKIRLRQNGGSGGHKGIESIISCLGYRDFIRLRIGIGRPPAEESSGEISEADTIDYVLGNFTPEQKQIIDKVIPLAGEAILCFLTEGLTTAMNRYNQSQL